MSVFNIKGRCYTLGLSLTELFEAAKARAMEIDPEKFKNVSFEVFSNMHRGRYNYGIGPEFMGITNEVLTEKEAAKKAAKAR